MLKVETLKRTDDNLFPEPSGELVEVLEKKRNKLRVVSKVEEVSEEQAPLDPTDYTVSELGDKLDNILLTADQEELLREKECQNKNRKTALETIREKA